MVFVRKSVWANGGDFNDAILYWYAKGVGVLKDRPINDLTSWRFLGAIHGFDPNKWQRYGYLSTGEQLPEKSVQDKYWQQCQHGSWYFLPWHRGYVASLEAIVRDAIIQAGGPTEWALPYWNYSDTNNSNARELPPAFSSQQLPDGSPNPLFVEQRYGSPLGSANVPIIIPPQDVDLKNTLEEPNFTGVASGGSPGFGGVKTLFSHSGRVHGVLENQPHDVVHVDIGGILGEFDPQSEVNNLGLMTDPDTAGLDPIFWLHHANIDRLWEVWLHRNSRHQNPIESAWLDDPLEREFIVPLPDGQSWKFTSKDVLQTSAPDLNYEYDDISDPLEGTTRIRRRLERLGSSLDSASVSSSNVDNPQNVELLGANSVKLEFTGQTSATQVQIDHPTLRKVARSFRSVETSESSAQEPDRIFLNLENIRAADDAVVLDVYINLPNSANPSDHPELYTGSVSFFGVSNASRSDQPHGGQGVTKVLEITDIIDTLHLSGEFDVSNLKVEFFSRKELKPADKVTVERVSIYRQGQ
jgi:tyrosinase